MKMLTTSQIMLLLDVCNGTETQKHSHSYNWDLSMLDDFQLTAYVEHKPWEFPHGRKLTDMGKEMCKQITQAAIKLLNNQK